MESRDNKAGQPISPSTEVNKIFTPLMATFRREIEAANAKGWNFPPLPQELIAYHSPLHTRTHETYAWSPLFTHAPEMQGFDALLGFYAPVGEYGRVWAQRLLTAGVTLANSATDVKSPVNIAWAIDDANTKNKYVLDTYTYRRTEVKHQGNKFHGPELTIREAFQSTLFAVGFLTMYQVPGYKDDPDGLTRDLVKDGVVSQLALIIAPQAAAEMGSSGTVFTNPTVVRGPDGKLALNPEIVKHFHEEVDHGRYKFHTTGADANLERHGCPVARRLPDYDTSGVNMAAQIFVDCLRAQQQYFKTEGENTK